TEPAKDLLVEKGWDPAMGARPLRRAIQRYIEDPLADFVLREELTPGATVVVDPAPEGDEQGDVKLSIVKPKKQKTPVGVGAEGGRGCPGRTGRAGRTRAGAGADAGGTGAKVVALRDVVAQRGRRLSTGIGELDRVLGGGLVPGSLVLLGGSPGIGKSTLTNMVLGHLERAGASTLYVSGEESAEQVRLRAERLGADALRVPIVAETDLDGILDVLAEHAP